MPDKSALKPFLSPKKGSLLRAPPPKANREVFADRYRLAAKIGRGRFADVCLAFDTVLKRDVAIKIFRPDPSLLETVGLEVLEARFLGEAEILAGLDHPNIVPVYDFGKVDGEFFLVMKYIPGVALSSPEVKLTPVALARVFSELAEALAYCHEFSAPIIHRDIKLQNILIDEARKPCLVDFGLFRFYTLEQSVVEWRNVLKTSIDYASPETIESLMTDPNGQKGTIDGRSDLWQLGNCMYRLLCGKPPLMESDLADYIQAVRTRKEILDLAGLVPEVPKVLSSIIMKCLAYEAPKRFSDGHKLAQALRQFIEAEEKERVEDVRLPSQMKLSSETILKELEQEFLKEADDLGSESRARSRQRRKWWVLGVALSLLGFFLWPKSEPEASKKHLAESSAARARLAPEPMSEEALSKAVGETEPALQIVRSVTGVPEPTKKQKERPAGLGVYRRASFTRPQGRPDSAGKGTVVWRRAGVSVGQTNSVGILKGTTIGSVVLLNTIVSFNMDAPVRVEIVRPVEVEGRVVFPRKTLFLGVAKAGRGGLDRVFVAFDTIVTPERKELKFKGRALMPDGSQGLIGRVDLQKDKTLVAGAGSAFSSTARAALRAADPTGFGAQFGTNLAEESLSSTDRDLDQARRVDRIITVGEYSPLQIYVDESF